MKFIDLFAGIGGFHLALKNKGFTCVFASEIDKNARLSYLFNFPEITEEIFNKDINNLDINKLPDFDLLCGGFPCQPFSIAGYQKGFNDLGRGDLIFKVIEILGLKQPRFVLLENVKNLLNHNKGKTYLKIKELITEKGYLVKEQILNTLTYGNLPQNRERLFIVAFKERKDYQSFQFPNPIPLTLKIKDILHSFKVDDYFYYNEKPLFNSLVNEITDKEKVYQWRRKYIRENKSNVCPTLTANMGTGGHNVPIIVDDYGIRKLTPRECLRLQGFPEGYDFPEKVSRSNRYKQIGNSISIPVIERIIDQLLPPPIGLIPSKQKLKDRV